MVKKLGILFSGGKDSMYAAWLAKKEGYKISCLISIVSENEESYMFHTPSIRRVEEQAKSMGIPLIIVKTKGKKEKELIDLEKSIKLAIKDYDIEGVISGAVESVYQASRIEKICNKLKIACFNPLWQKNQLELLEDLIKNKFEVIVVGVFAYPFDEKWLGRKIDTKFINEIKKLQEKYKINVAGEGGEFESFVLNCSLFKKRLKIKDKKIKGSKNSWRMDIKLE
ncbi:TIGR00289 family protein [Candidatus Pacearchaeota archaeon]|jgi:ABC transporter with metal-binding/Fe-S-binding domain ATP-binding protein|nr:TIGR00289 family protein [Candidatus Pacearchaeota archaeon]|tara:strand:- start:4567 stop:5241 length:675 start_codon:yes stop_codon:yes gene_type:complete